MVRIFTLRPFVDIPVKMERVYFFLLPRLQQFYFMIFLIFYTDRMQVFYFIRNQAFLFQVSLLWIAPKLWRTVLLLNSRLNEIFDYLLDIICYKEVIDLWSTRASFKPKLKK